MVRPSESVLFGGAGFIGRHVTARLLREDVARVTVADLRTPDWQLPEGARFVECDVRQPIAAGLVDSSPAIFNLAAVHRTPGHADHEYFETNEAGARNVTAFARATTARVIWFTSSIAVYGPSEEAKTEASPLEPASAYGKSKMVAERIHREWAEEGDGRRLVIARPATVFGPGECGNFTRLAGALAQRRFVYPGRRDTRKACGYVDDLVSSMLFIEQFADPVAIYNFGYREPPTIEEICDAFAAAGSLPLPRGTIPLAVLLLAARVLRRMGLTSYDPERVMKLVRSTNIRAERLQEYGYEYETDLRSALARWQRTDPVGKFV